MGIDRNEGYAVGAPKEEAGLSHVERFFREVLGVTLSRISDRNEQRTQGDFRATSGATIECKRQSIDPKKFRQLNFVEVFEDVSKGAKEIHRGGLGLVAAILGYKDTGPLEAACVTFHEHGQEPTDEGPLGHRSHISASVESFAGAAWVVYVNPINGYLYVYEASALLVMVRREIDTHRKLDRGRGGSNDQTFSVRTRIPAWIWRLDRGIWVWHGTASDEEMAVKRLRDSLG